MGNQENAEEPKPIEVREQKLLTRERTAVSILRKSLGYREEYDSPGLVRLIQSLVNKKETAEAALGKAIAERDFVLKYVEVCDVGDEDASPGICIDEEGLSESLVKYYDTDWLVDGVLPVVRRAIIAAKKEEE